MLLFWACDASGPNLPAEKVVNEEEPALLYLGADLSYVNEMLDCGGTFRKGGAVVDPYSLFANEGANIVRLRLWHNPTWTNYSTLMDIKRSMQAAKQSGMSVLLDFHYSDDWADPAKQIVPAAWKNVVNNVPILGDSIYNYTYETLSTLYEADLLPLIVQIGNEINSEILLEAPADKPINWTRNSFLLNRGLQAVYQFNMDYQVHIETMLHIAQPENAFWWMEAAQQNDLSNFDWLGISYYPKWSEYELEELDDAIASLVKGYGKSVMIVETAYPYTLEGFDAANNILGQDATITNYPPTPEGQRDYLIHLTQKVFEGGGSGVIYWEPAWISTDCSTRWGKGSHWENATFFDAANDNEALPALSFLNYKY